jgi:hypothetical protein
VAHIRETTFFLDARNQAMLSLTETVLQSGKIETNGKPNAHA